MQNLPRLNSSDQKRRALVLTLCLVGVAGVARAQWEPFKLAPPSPTKQWDAPTLPTYRKELEQLRSHDGNPLTIRTSDGLEIRLQPRHVYSLPELVDIAELVNPETRVSWGQARKAAIAVGLYQSSYYPQIRFLGALAKNQLNVNTPSEIDILARADVRSRLAAPILNLKWLLFDFGGRAATIDTSKEKLASANFVFNARHQQIILRVTKAYYALNTAVGKVRVARIAVESADSVERAATLRLNTGLGTQIDVLLSRQQASQALYELDQASAAESLARAELSDSMGIRATVPLQVRDISQAVLPVRLSETVDAVIDRALVQRPDLLARVAAVRGAEAELRKERSEYWPRLALNGTLQKLFSTGTTDPGPGVTQDIRVKGYSMFLNLEWTLFDGLANVNRVRLAKTERFVAEQELEIARDEAVSQVFRAYTNLRSSIHRRQAAQALLTASNEAYKGSVESYKNGLSTINDVLASRRGFTNAQEVELANLAEIYTNWTALAYATGELGVKPSAGRTTTRGK
jgi:outer membrane protein